MLLNTIAEKHPNSWMDMKMEFIQKKSIKKES